LKRACSMFMASGASGGGRIEGELYQTGTIH
jgi:hypothetical protein